MQCALSGSDELKIESNENLSSELLFLKEVGDEMCKLHRTLAGVYSTVGAGAISLTTRIPKTQKLPLEKLVLLKDLP